jgi:L,D-peptidoglycan transpeptidase YkuD (ErfK/YbiS/YcfS/YnhG family)
MEKRGENWRRVLGPFRAVVGRNGFALPGEKREGDGKTPSGIFAVEHAFGDAQHVATALPYRLIAHDDIWVDDPLSADYNKWTKKGETGALSFEEMERHDSLYRYGLVIGYNRNPVVKGFGSAIFLHVWKGCNIPTSGCVALAENDVIAILARLDPSRQPLSLWGTLDSEKKHVQP